MNHPSEKKDLLDHLSEGRVKEEFSELYLAGLFGGLFRILRPLAIDLLITLSFLLIAYKGFAWIGIQTPCSEQCITTAASEMCCPGSTAFILLIGTFLGSVFAAHYTTLRIFSEKRFQRSSLLTVVLEILFLYGTYSLPFAFWIKGLMVIALFLLCFWAYRLSLR